MAVAWTSVLHNKYLQLCTGLAFSASRLDQLLDAPMHDRFCKELPLEELSDKLDVAEAMLLSKRDTTSLPVRYWQASWQVKDGWLQPLGWAWRPSKHSQ